jgi:hypothetical protein
VQHDEGGIALNHFLDAIKRIIFVCLCGTQHDEGGIVLNYFLVTVNPVISVCLCAGNSLAVVCGDRGGYIHCEYEC